jgi:hypothetical protein
VRMSPAICKSTDYRNRFGQMTHWACCLLEPSLGKDCLTAFKMLNRPWSADQFTTLPTPQTQAFSGIGSGNGDGYSKIKLIPAPGQVWCMCDVDLSFCPELPADCVGGMFTKAGTVCPVYPALSTSCCHDVLLQGTSLLNACSCADGADDSSCASVTRQDSALHCIHATLTYYYVHLYVVDVVVSECAVSTCLYISVSDTCRCCSS